MHEFEQSLYNLLAYLPEGKLCSYGQMAKRSGYPNYARHVGKTLSKLPSDTKLPWHRIVNSQGKISLVGDAFIRQSERLAAEGFIIDETGKIKNVKQYWW